MSQSGRQEDFAKHASTREVIPVLYRDADIIAFDKPAGLATQGVRPNLFDIVTSSEPGYFALHHRLDAATSGVLLMACSERANAGLARLFSSARIKKTYVLFALSAQPFPGRFDVRESIAKDPKASNRMMIAESGDEALTHYALCGQKKFGNLYAAALFARPVTGRTHQIRVHLGVERASIVGDKVYGLHRLPPALSNVLTEKRLMLHALSLSFKHPVTGEEIFVCSEPPKIFAIMASLLDISGKLIDNARDAFASFG